MPDTDKRVVGGTAKGSVFIVTKDQLNEYILHYINEDKTGSAIMLTAPWGSGKSYYIQNELIPFLNKDENGKRKCIVVSLYGLNSTYELSKAIYLESRLKVINKNSETLAAGKLAVKTVVKGVASFFNVDLSKSEDDLKKLYDSIDLSDNLIIIEDLERSGIDILEILGYVNNLVEQDGVKVLLVANEDELLKYEPLEFSDPSKKETTKLLDEITHHKGREYTQYTKDYVKTKEKTISDTIIYEGDYDEAIKSIIHRFESAYLNRFTDADRFEELISLCNAYQVFNLRSFIFACQKTVDILRIIQPSESEDADFIKTIFYSIILFSKKYKDGERLYWDEGYYLSIDLSSVEYPLFRFCYDYITEQTFDKGIAPEAKDELKKYRLYDQRKIYSDPDLNTIYSWYICSEKEVLTAIYSITEKIKTKINIPYFEYGRIAAYLVTIKDVLECNIDEAKTLLVDNLYNKGNEINPDYLFTNFLSDNESEEAKKEFSQLKTDMTNSLLAKKETLFSFDYSPKNINKFGKDAEKHRGKILESGEFLSRLDVDKIIDMLKKCSAIEIHEFRMAFLSVYRYNNLWDYFKSDEIAIKELSEKVKTLLDYDGFDKIQKKQMEYFIENLKGVLEKLK